MLSQHQLNEFHRNGILRVSRAISAGDIEAVTAQVWDNIEREQHAPDASTLGRGVWNP
ncbi:MAG: hypothetical protein JO033_01645 [Acidobacteriaceae bacterium]|nr:hypothetical protein [Acidobacteriaceae bacterium]